MKTQVSADSAPSNEPEVNQDTEQLEGVFATLRQGVKRAITTAGYVTPTDIQSQCIPHLIEGRDLIGSAQTGTGKTAAFVLPLLERLADNQRRPERCMPRALILAPTRELAAQIGESIRTYGRFLRVSHTVIFGGVSQQPQVKALNRGVDIVVATPGRLLDLMEQRRLCLSQVEVFILDEVDRMLDMGFIPDIKEILGKIPEQRQTLFFSATMAPKMEELAKSMVTNPVRISIEPGQPAVDRIVQKILFVGQRNKPALLVSLLKDEEIKKAIIFTQMKHVANRVVEKLEAAGITSVAIHGNKTQAARTKALDGFKRNRFRVLVATDVAARGLDVDDITHVINYDLPMEAETYVHRIGRTARAGAEGDAISFCSADEKAYLKQIERLLGDRVPFDKEHAYHCDEAFRSKMAAPTFRKGKGGGGGKRFGGGGGGKRFGGGRSGGGGRPSGGGGFNKKSSRPQKRNTGR